MIYPDALVKSKKELIEAFRTSKYGIQPDGSVSPGQKELREDLTNAVEQLSTGLYQKNVHFLMELIQNAEDNAYQDGVQPQLKLVLLDEDPTATAGSDGCLCVFNNETGFTQENIKGISGVGKSTKKNIQGYIGEKGIGFKSVFIVSASPHIFSGGYQIRFFEKDEAFDLNYIVPYWVNSVPNVVRNEGMTTSLLLPLKPGKKTEIIDHLKSIKAESLLFLKKLRSLSIEIPNESTIRIAVSDPDNGVVNLSSDKEGKTLTNRYWLHSESLGVPQYLKEGEQKEEKREGIDNIDITLALPLDKSETEGRVFAYLPTEVDSGLPFLINSDFLLTANRESFQADRPWNQWLKGEISGVILNALEKMRHQDAYRKLFYRYIPLEDDLSALPDYFAPVMDEVITVLSEKPIVLTSTGDLLLASYTRFPSKKIRTLFPPESLPVWFDSAGFVDQELNQFERQIREIGGKNLMKSEFPLLLDDKEWLNKQPESWLSNLWTFLCEEKYKKEVLADKYLMPTQQGIRKRSMDHVYFSYNAELVASLPEESRELVHFLQKNFVDKKVLDYLREESFVHDFSIDNFITGGWLEYVTKTVNESFSVEWFMEVNTFLCSTLPRLNERTHRTLETKFYILSEEDEPVSLASKDSTQVLFPKGFDTVTGWQLFFDPVLDHGNCEVLSDKYLSLKDCNRESIENLLVLLGGTKMPVTAKRAVTRSDARRDSYCMFAFEGFSSHYTRKYDPILHYYPNIARFNSLVNTETKRLAYLRWIEDFIENRCLNRQHIEYQSYGEKSERVFMSSVIYEAKQCPWIRTQLGLKKPSEVFVDKTSTREVLGNTVSYLQDEISKRLRQQLGIREEANSDELLQYLKDASSGKRVVDQSVLLRVYNYLDSPNLDSEKVTSLFSDEALIYVPEQGWMKSTQTIWEDAAAVFGSSHGWLSKHYPDSLRVFFVDQVGVKEQVDDDSYIDAWLTYQESSKASVSEVESFVALAMPRIIKMIKANPKRESLNVFQQKAKLWSKAKNWQTRHWLYSPDNPKLTKIFNSDLNFVWRLPGKSYEYMLPLLDYLAIPSLSGAAKYDVDHASNSEPREQRLLTKHSTKLLAYFLNSQDRDEKGILQARVDDGLFESLYKVEECVVSQLVINVSVDQYTAKIPDQTCFLDKENNKLFIDKTADYEELKEELAAILKRELFGGRQGEFEDTIIRLLGVSDDKREASIREKKGWHLSRSLLKEINALEKAQQEKLSDKVESDSTPPQKASTAEPKSEEEAPSHPIEDVATEESMQGGMLPPRSDLVKSEPTRQPPTSNSGFSGASNTSTGRKSRSLSGNSSSGRFKGNAKPGKSRSNPANNIRTGRLRSYVSKEKREGDQPTSERNQFNQELGSEAEKIVKSDLIAKGYDVKEMPTNNRGYDLEAMNRDTGELFHVEVKGSFTEWSDKGVAISKPQYQLAEKSQENFILAVVDNLEATPNPPVYLRNPVGKITEYRFDRGWADASVDMLIDSVEPQLAEVIDPVAERVELTDSEECKALLLYCDEQNYPIPEVGVELQDESEEVIFDTLELCWQEERIAIVMDQSELEQVQDLIDGWTFWVADEGEVLFERLDETFG